MNEQIAKFKIGDEVNVKYSGKWSKEKFHISHTWYTVENGRQYNVSENGDTFSETEIRLAK